MEADSLASSETKVIRKSKQQLQKASNNEITLVHVYDTFKGSIKLTQSQFLRGKLQTKPKFTSL